MMLFAGYMKQVYDRSLAHLNAVNLTYFEHMLRASRFLFTLTKCQAMLCAHAFVPGLFTHATSHEVEQLLIQMKAN
jgi:hypothetical protein